MKFEITMALRVLSVLKPGLKTEIAVDLNETGKVSLWRAADIAGMSLEGVQGASGHKVD
jgi:predicted HTH domain antitoxin